MQSRVPALMSLIDGARRFLAWWSDELVGLMPERVRRLFVDEDASVVLAQVDTGFQIIDGSAPRTRQCPGGAISRASHFDAGKRWQHRAGSAPSASACP